MLLSIMYFLFGKQFLFSVSDWLKFLLIFSLKKEKIEIFYHVGNQILEWEGCQYFISQKVVKIYLVTRRFYQSLVLFEMLGVLFIYLGHYLKFKREFKNENVFAILFVKFVLWMFFKRILFLQEMCELWQRESCLNFVYVFRQQEHVVGI